MSCQFNPVASPVFASHIIEQVPAGFSVATTSSKTAADSVEYILGCLVKLLQVNCIELVFDGNVS